MSNLDAGLVADRIKVATPSSQIIVEKLGYGLYQSFFADTVYGFKYLKNPPKGFIGAFHGDKGAKDFLEKRLLNSYVTAEAR